ncbi:MAG: transglutaminase domain-containing protein [Candidatus Saccharimonadaceae bacterium]
MQPVASVPAPLPPAQSTKPSHKKRLIIIAAIIIALIIAVVFIIIANLNRTASESINANLPFEYTNPELNIDPKKIFSFDLGYEPKVATDAVDIYIDSAFSIQAPEASINTNVAGKLRIIPSSAYISTTVGGSRDTPSKGISIENQWSFSDEYFIVQKVNLKNGETLVKPKVTRVTVQKKIAKPTVSFAADSEGIGHFSWRAIDGAAKYYVVRIDKGTDKTHPEIVGSTTKTEWTTAEQDSDMKAWMQDKTFGASSQNSQFKNFEYSEDDLRDPTRTFSATQKITQSVYGVIALKDQETYSFGMLGGDNGMIAKTLPYSFAINAGYEMKSNGLFALNFDVLPAQRPVTMADGSTVVRSVLLDIDKATMTAGVTKVPFKIEGTIFAGQYSIYNSGADYRDQLKRVATRNKQSQVKTGEKVVFTYTTEKKDLGSSEISKTAPKVDYKVNATNDFTAYLAANMIAGNQYIDVSKFIDTTNGISVTDAAREADSQNPYVLGIQGLEYVSSQKVLIVNYTVKPRDERAKEQKAISAEVDRVTAKIITAGMSEEQKIKAINDYIVETASYNYDALASIDDGTTDNFKHAWTPAGILLDKTGVCGGYAVTFKVLADKAGLESVYVTGVANGNGHAWDKVKVNNAWRVIDVTWNDSQSAPNKYYLLTDTQANETRTQSNNFVIDVLVGNYAAN